VSSVGNIRSIYGLAPRPEPVGPEGPGPTGSTIPAVTSVATGRVRPVSSAAYVRLLGAVRFVSGEGETVEIRSTTQRRLLAVLALASGATLRPEYLTDLLDVSPGALRTTVSRLRARIGDDTICTDAVGYRVTCTADSTIFTDLLLDETDVADRLVALDEALALWDGPALDEFRHEPWAEAEAARLDELHRLAVEHRAELLIRRSRAGEAVAALEAHVARNPLRDRGWALLIRALAGEGRQADALRAYQEYRTLLAEGTGTEPSEVVRSIERRVAAGWQGDDGSDDETHASSFRRPPTGSVATHSVRLPGVLAQGPPLIGRRRELTWLESALVQVRPGSLHSVLLSGEPGIGKTTLVAAFARAYGARGTTAVVYGRCEEGAAVPLQPFRDVVGTLVDDAPTSVLVAHCERFGGELARVAPQLAQRVGAPAPMSADDATERYQLFEAVADLVRRLAAIGPLVLILDDLHWAEPTALLLLRHLARALVDAPVLVVASYRDTGEGGSVELRAALADLDRGNSRHIRLSGFDDAELSDLVVAVVDAPSGPASALLAHLREQTAGNPLYAAQLVRHLVESGHAVVDDDGVHLSGSLHGTAVPPNLLGVVWTRVQALGESAHDVLRAAAVLGAEFDADMVLDMLDGSDAEVEAALDASVGAGLLVDTGDASRTMRFVHALVADALYSELRGPRRRRLHERAARVLQKRSDELPQSVVVQLAHHWALAGDRSAAQRWATAAGDHAFGHLAPSEAASWYETALDHAVALQRPEAERADLMVRLGEARHRAGDPRAHDLLLAGADLARRCGADDVLIRAALANDRGIMRLGTVDHAELAAVEAAIAVADPDDAATYSRLLALYARELIHTPRFELRQEMARRAIDLIDAVDDRTLLPNMISGLTYALWGPGALPLRRDIAARAEDVAYGTDDPFLRFWTTRAAFVVAIESADSAWARRSLGRIREIAAEIREPRLRWIALVYETFTATMEARLDDADRASELGLEIGMQIGEPEAFSLYAGQLFVNRSFSGRYGELLPLVEGIMRANPDVLPFRLAYGITSLWVDRHDEARAILAEGSAGGFARIPVDYFWMTTVIGYAILAIELHDAERAAELYPMLEPFGDEVAFNGVTSQGPISAYLGKLASLMGLHDAADAHLRRALDTAVAFGWKYHEATTSVALALSQRRRTGALDREATRWLDAAEAIGVEHGLSIVIIQVASVRA
jgi:DNA-binding SARP family transcriptional activator/DNA polymerase III delta prime subunit